MDGVTAFRRALIDRPRRRVVVEVAPRQFWVLPGQYDPDQMLERVIRARYVDLAKWEKFA